MRSQNWRIRKAPNDEQFFFVEADLPDAEKNGHYPRLEVMQEDFGEHNGYTYEMRMADAKLIADAPNLLAVLNQIVSSPTPYNERELQSWYETARNLALDAVAQHSI